MAEVSGYRNYKNRFGHFDGETDFVLACSLSGRVVHASAEIKLRMGTELAGRNLNDFLDDKTVFDIIAKSAVGDCCRFSCILAGRKYSAISEKEGGVITIAFYEGDSVNVSSLGESSLKYLQSELNTLLANLMGAVRNFGSTDSPNVMFAKRNIYRLLRASRNVFDCISVEDGSMSAEMFDHDILEICMAVVEKLKFPLRSVNAELEIWHDGEKHICSCVSEHVERMLSGIISCALKGCDSGGGTRFIKIEIISKEKDVLVSVLSQKRILNERMLANVFNGGSGEHNGIDREILQTLLTVKSLAAYNRGSFIMTAEKECDRMTFLLPKADADRMYRFKSPGVKYMNGTNTALVELSEILPDSLY